MKKQSHILFIALLVYGFFMNPYNTLHAGNAVEEKHVKEYLLERVNDDSFWNRIHALEFLCEAGFQNEVKNILKNSFAGIESLPQKRIGYWRCHANSSTSADEKSIYLEKILNVYLSVDSPDKIHACESLAKLKMSLRDYPLASIDDDSTQNNILQSYIAWANILPSPPSERLDYNTLFSLLNSGDKSTRKIIAYGISFLGLFEKQQWEKLASMALSETHESECAIHLLHGALVSCPDRAEYKVLTVRIREQLKQLGMTDNKTNRYNTFVAFGTFCEKEDFEYVLSAFNNGENNGQSILSEDDKKDIISAAAFAILQINNKQVKHQFYFFDWFIIIIFLLYMLFIGYSSSKKNKTSNDYVLGGNRMNSMMIGISLFATLLSTLSYLAYPGEMIKYGPVVFTGLLAFPVANWIVGRYLIPKFMVMKVTSAYEILEIKLGKGCRNLATIYFLTLRFLWMSTIVYATVDIALMPIMGFSKEFVPIISIALVLITVVYTTMGGIKAVVITDVLQTLVMFAGVILTIIVVMWKIGSIEAFFEPFLYAHWENVDLSINATKRMTVGNIFIMTLVWQICTAGSDQMAIQRYLATKNAKEAGRSYKISLITSCVIQLLLALVGITVMAYFTYNTSQMEPGQTIFNNADTLFPRFILVGLPVGITGLIVAAIMSAAMSSLSSGLNSSAAVIREDIVNRIVKNKVRDSQSELKAIKRTCALLGVAISCSCFLVAYVTGNLFDVVVKVVNLVVAPLFVLFFMALFIPFATNRATIIAGILSLVTAILIAFFEIFNIKVLWVMPAALIVGIIVGVSLSYIENRLLTKNLKV